MRWLELPQTVEDNSTGASGGERGAEERRQRVRRRAAGAREEGGAGAVTEGDIGGFVALSDT